MSLSSKLQRTCLCLGPVFTQQRPPGSRQAREQGTQDRGTRNTMPFVVNIRIVRVHYCDSVQSWGGVCSSPLPPPNPPTHCLNVADSLVFHPGLGLGGI